MACTLLTTETRATLTREAQAALAFQAYMIQAAEEEAMLAEAGALELDSDPMADLGWASSLYLRRTF